MKTESKQEQYAAYLRNGGTMTLQQWENDSRYDPHLAGERITLEQQIENQKETIASLTKTIEILEKELQKCTDPDSGEIRLTRPGQKHGEAALIDQIASLQKQLDDCLDVPETIRFRNGIENTEIIKSLIKNISPGIFLPQKSHNSAGKTIHRGKWAIWVTLRSALHQCRVIDGFWSNPDFRLVMDSVNDICEQLLIANRMDDDPDYAMVHYRNAANRLTMDADEDVHKGTLHLKAAIEELYALREDDRMNLETEEIDYLFFSIQIIIQCQRLWLSLVQPEEKKDQEAELHQK